MTAINQRSILVVEDEELLLSAIVMKLEAMGFRALGARTVDQAWDFLNTMQPIDALWIDHYLPEKTGDVLVAAVRQDARWKQMPIFLVTNSISPEIVNKYLKLGITQYYLKFVNKLDSIINMIEAELQQQA